MRHGHGIRAHAESFAGGVSVRPLPPAGAPGPRRARRRVIPTRGKAAAPYYREAHMARGRAPPRTPLAPIRGRAPARGNIQLKVTSLFGILSAHEV